MSLKKTPPDAARRDQLVAELRRDHDIRQKSYRERALKIFPHVCGRCGRELSGRRLRELTVHHKDHNYHNNPPDGSNWELLCLYCHDHEHEKYRMAGHGDGSAAPNGQSAPSLFSPFEGLDALLKSGNEERGQESK